MTPSTIDPLQLHERRTRGEACLCLDVRTPLERRALHASGTEPMPLDRLDPERVRQLRREGQPVFVFCKTGARATQAVERLAAAGLSGCHVVAGGTDAWAAAGLPVVRGQAGMSLERQVRIAAGSLVLLGSLLAWAVHMGFLGLPAFVGGGLVFASLTDWCGMGLLLARMPWNQVGQEIAQECETRAR